MSSTKDDIIRSASLKCCQNSSMTSITTDENSIICEAKNNYITDSYGNSLEMHNNNYNFHNNNQQLKKHKFPRRPPANLIFDNITYRTWTWSMTRFKRENKEILHGVSGVFKSGELSVIMGPSGAGKTTLLNVLAGYTTRGSTGTVRVNETVRDHSDQFRILSAYIPQQEELRLNITAMEAMNFAAHLKLGYGVTNAYKMQQITEILDILGLVECHNTLTAKLSGGQRKRLAIALELINNPPILFLDEPTTGLDSLSCSQCVSLLKRLAQEGRTIICTIHQPSALIFEMFDQLYALADGNCIFQGKTSQLVPQLASVGLQCPAYHNPADFLMEIAIGEYDIDLKKLIDLANYNKYTDLEPNANDKEVLAIKCIDEDNKEATTPTMLRQFGLLYSRNFLCARRNYIYLFNRLAAHILIGCLFGYLYRGVGKGADTALANYVYLYGTLLLLVYTGKMSVTISFPLEMQILTREHFNRWYHLLPYVLSILLLEIPFQIICAWFYIAISYWLTEQPVDFRLYLFLMFCTLTSLCAQAWGYFIGATTPIKIAVFIGPVLACLFSVFGFCIRYYDTPVIFRWMYHISYYRAGFQSVVYGMYGFNRTKLECPDHFIYCHYKDPTKVLSDLGIQELNFAENIGLIVGIGCLMHICTYVSLWIKLHKR